MTCGTNFPSETAGSHLGAFAKTSFMDFEKSPPSFLIKTEPIEPSAFTVNSYSTRPLLYSRFFGYFNLGDM